MDVNEILMIVWAAVIAATLIIEFLTCDFAAICFGVAAIPTLILSAFEVGLEWQIPVYIITAVLLVSFIRPICKKFLVRKTIPTNVDANFGKKVKLLADVVEGASTVKLGDVIWTAACNETLKAGDVVEIIGAEGNKLTVKGGK